MLFRSLSAPFTHSASLRRPVLWHNPNRQQCLALAACSPPILLAQLRSMTSQWQTVRWGCGLCALLVVPTRGDAIYHMVQPGRLRALYGFDGHMNSTADADAGSALADGMEATIVGGGRYTNVAVEGLAYYMPGGDSYIEAPVDVSPTSHPQLSMGAWVKPVSWNNELADGAAFDPMRFLLSSDNGGYARAIGIRSAGVDDVGWSAYAGTADKGSSKASGTAHTLPVALGQWSFVAVVYDQHTATATTYVDGVVAMRSTADRKSVV